MMGRREEISHVVEAEGIKAVDESGQAKVMESKGRKRVDEDNNEGFTRLVKMMMK